MALTPHLFIGVGGTGGKTLGVIRESLLSSVKALGMSELPRGWQFLHIDVPTDPDARMEGLPYALPRSQYLGLAARTSTFTNMSAGVSSSLVASGRDRHLAWDCWRPWPPETVKVTIAKGAGQFRAVGRVASVHGLKQMDARVASALSVIADPLTQGELSDVQRARGATVVDQSTTGPSVMVIGSVAGGSGSGMLLDVCDVVRSQGVQSLSAVVFTPEVFGTDLRPLDTGVAPNTFCAIHELSNAMWTIGTPGDSSRDTLFARAGISRVAGYGGPAAVFLVGRSNGSINLAGSDEVYSVVGHSLAEVALDEQLSNSLEAYVRTNMQSRTTGLSDHLALSAQTSRDLALFTALGFGRVALGRSYFERYASERLVRLAVERLLDRHLLLHHPGDGKTDEQVLSEAADRVWDSFVGASGINEAGDGHNDINVALDPLRALESELRSFERELTAKLSGLGAGKRIDTRQARAKASEAVASQKGADSGIVVKARAVMVARLPQWSRTVADGLRDLIIATAAQEGLPVTSELIDRLISHSERGIAEIRQVDLKRAKDTLQTRHQVLASGAPGEEKRVRGDNPLLGTIATQARKVMESELRVQALSVVAEALADLVENLLKPWQRAIRDADELLRAQARPAERRSPVDRMPGSAGVPEHLLPSRVEYLLEEPETFPQTFLDQVGYSAGDNVDISDGEGLLTAIEEVVSQVITGERLNPLGREVKRTATYQRFWIPEFGATQPPARASIQTALGVRDLEERVFAWLHDDRKQVGRYLRQTLHDYVAAPGLSESESLHHQDRLVNQFGAALRVAAPLIRLDANLVQAIHNQDAPPHWMTVSPINVPDHMKELRARLTDVAAAVVGPGLSLSFTSVPAEGATILTSFDNPYHPLEVASIMEPISSQWIAGRSNQDFWLWRRTAPLPEWVPLSPNSLTCLIRGWFAARFLGRASFVPSAMGGRFDVFVPGSLEGDGRWARIEVPGMRTASNRDHVANLVEALPLQMIEAYTAHSLEPLAPYQALIALGASLGTPQDGLSRWVSSGTGLVDPSRAYCPDSTDRAGDLVRTCTQLIENYARLSQESHLADPAVAQNQPRHEILADVIEALTSLKASATYDDDDDIL